MGMKGRSLMKKHIEYLGAAIISAATLMTFTGCAFKQPVYTSLKATSGSTATAGYRQASYCNKHFGV